MTSSVKSRPKFRIIEGNYDILNKKQYEEFKKDYLSINITTKEMQEKYDISPNQYIHLKNKVAEETGVNRKMSRKNIGNRWRHHLRYIDKINATGHYRVTKYTLGKKCHYGVYKDLKTAVYVRDTLEANNWSHDVYKELRFEIFDEEDKRDKIERIYDEFKVDFLNGESMKYLFKKYHIGQTTYKNLSQMIRSETGIKKKPQLPFDVMRQHERDISKKQN